MLGVDSSAKHTNLANGLHGLKLLSTYECIRKWGLYKSDPKCVRTNMPNPDALISAGFFVSMAEPRVTSSVSMAIVRASASAKVFGLLDSCVNPERHCGFGRGGSYTKNEGGLALEFEDCATDTSV